MRWTRRSTPSERIVIMVGAAAAPVLMGLVGVGFRLVHPPSQPQVAELLTTVSVGLIGIGVFIAAAIRLYCWLTG